MRPKPLLNCAIGQFCDAETPDFGPDQLEALNPGSDWTGTGFPPSAYKIWSRTGALIRTTDRPNQQSLGAAQSDPIAVGNH